MIETRAVAADHHEIRGPRARAEPTDRDARARGTAIRELRDGEEAIGLRERGDRAGALGRGIGGKGARLTARHADQGDHDELGAPELGGHAGRKRRLDGLGGFRRPTAIGADEGRREFLEGEHGRGRKARQHDHGLGADDRQAERLAGLQRDAMHEDAGLAEARDRPVRDVARAFGGAARQDDEIGLLERLAQRQLQRRLVVRHDPERDGLAAQLLNGGRDRGGVAVVHRARANRSARRDDLVAGGEHGDPRPAPDLEAGTTDRREHADLARGQQLAPPEHGLAARQIAPGEGDQLPRHRRPHHANGPGRVVEIGMLDHQHRIGAARNHAAGRDHGRGAGQHRQAGRHARESAPRH